MSDLKDRVGVLTGGNANLIVNPGDLITGDGNQTVYKRAATGNDGDVLSLDSTAEDGLAWVPQGGGAALTFSDGVTKTVNNVTNDLVTGEDVAQLNVDSLGPATIDAPGGAANGIILTVDSGGTPQENPTLALGNANGASATIANLSARLVQLTGDDGILETATTGDITSLALAGIVQAKTFAAGVGVTINPGGIDLVVDGTTAGGIRLATDTGLTSPADGEVLISATNQFTVTAGLDINISTGAAIGMSAGGVVDITSQADDLFLDAGTVGGTGEIRLQNGTASATRTFGIWTGAGAPQRDGQINPAGGGTIDVEMRAAFDTLLNYLFDWGWITNPTP